MYKEYTIDKVDDSALDEIRRGYKTAEETDEGKTKVLADNNHMKNIIMPLSRKA